MIIPLIEYANILPFFRKKASLQLPISPNTHTTLGKYFIYHNSVSFSLKTILLNKKNRFFSMGLAKTNKSISISNAKIVYLVIFYDFFFIIIKFNGK